VTRYVLDTDVVIALQRADAQSVLASRGLLPVVITDVVWDELRAPGDPGARSITFAGTIARTPTVLEADSVEAGTLLQLQGAPKTEGPGEHSVIAYCHHHVDTTAVLMDKAAIRRAVEELRGRVLSLQGLLAALVTDGYLEWADASLVAARYRQHFSHARVPIWWPVG
jgi:hypothetical protein